MRGPKRWLYLIWAVCTLVGMGSLLMAGVMPFWFPVICLFSLMQIYYE